MKLFWILVLFGSYQARAEDVGDGSDGACTTATITTAKRSYQCTSLTIDADLLVFSGNNLAGANGAPLIIKVQNDVVVNAGTTVNLNGQDGIDGDAASGKNGGRAGAGGNAGGNSTLFPATGNGQNGLGVGGGVAGNHVISTNPGVNSSYGGGGGGGSFGTKDPIEPIQGDDASGGGTAPGSVGSNQNVPPGINESNFETTFTGGFGGGAGGGGNTLGGAGTDKSGSSGGGGGGAIRIIAGGNITVDGDITVNGGDGGGTAAIESSGGGGGGSGGAIWLQAAGQLTINGNLDSLGGGFGENISGVNGIGGNGGMGRIRLDDGDGAIVNNGTVTPVAFSTTFTPTPLPGPGPTPGPGTSPISVRQYSSGVSCAKVALDSSTENFAINLILGMGLALGFGLLGKRKVRA